MSRIISGEAEEGEEGETQLYSMSKPLKGKTPTKDTNQLFTVGTRCYDRMGGKYVGFFYNFLNIHENSGYF